MEEINLVKGNPDEKLYIVRKCSSDEPLNGDINPKRR